jgi:5-methyltetrahydropteroyltriglutamate--homocysteine methyltransferase
MEEALMKRSTDRILTSHVGSLPRPPDLRQMLDAKARGEPYDKDAFAKRLKTAVAETVQKQAEVGLDVINDGEMHKPSWSGYVRDRLGGFEIKPLVSVVGREQREFPEYSAGRTGGVREAAPSMVCTGPITYIGQAEIQEDIDNLKAAVARANVTEVFMAAVGPDNVGYQPGQNEYYPNDEAYIEANAAAMKTEYKAIADAGFVLQIDTPVMKYNALSLTKEEFRARFGRLVDLMNETLKDIPEEQVRLHICYGGMRAPHSGDIGLEDYADLLIKINAGGYSLDQNVRHEHEWKVWKDVKLPDGKLLMPGVVAHTTDVIEHPQLIADRIVRLANVVGRENVIAGTDCGLGGRVPQEIAWAKFRSMVEGARIASKELWG